MKFVIAVSNGSICAFIQWLYELLSSENILLSMHYFMLGHLLYVGTHG